jgi:hypothetical protein
LIPKKIAYRVMSGIELSFLREAMAISPTKSFPVGKLKPHDETSLQQ